jgi:penicillin-binding protein 1A
MTDEQPPQPGAQPPRRIEQWPPQKGAPHPLLVRAKAWAAGALGGAREAADSVAARGVRKSFLGLSRLARWIIGLAITGFIFAIIAITLVIAHFTKDLPSTDQLANYDPAVVTRLYAGDGKLLAEYAKEKRFFLPLSAIPKNVEQAFISAEDRNFYSHQGIDFWGILRAVKENVTNVGSGRTMVGGSTITQQVVKNFLLTSEKSFERKIKEAILAYRISNTYSKEKILELYLNEIYLGQGTYGVAAAAINYFGKSLDELSTEEAAMLAAMPKAPAYYDPAKNYKRALARRNYVINRMLGDGFIDSAEAERAAATPITLKPRDKGEVAHADFFAEEVRRNLKEMYGDHILYEGGLFVKTTLNPAFQDYADRGLRHALMLYDQRHGYRGPVASLKNDMNDWEASLARIQQEKTITLYDEQQLAVITAVNGKTLSIGLMNGEDGAVEASGYSWVLSPRWAVGDVILVEPTDDKKSWKIFQVPAVNGAMIVMDPKTGKVLALSGGYAYAGSEFNRATQAKRQPGSSFKPFVYLTALENGFSPTSIIIDGPVSLPQGPGLPMWTPKNYEGSYLGPTTFRNGLEKSRNAMTVRIAQMIGIKRVMRVAQRFGIYDRVEPNYSMVLGSKETTPMKLANAYAMIANGGRRVSPWLIERIDDRNGATIFRRDTRICEPCSLAMDAKYDPKPPTLPDERERVLDPRVAYQLTSILQGAILRGTGTAAKVLARPLAGKTGTTNESRDTWFVGYTPDIVVATYVGFDTPKPMGAKETGGRVPIQGFIKFMQQAAKDIPMTPFRPPEGIREIPVDRATGQPLYDGATGGATIMEAFLTGGPIFKPFNELQEELKDKKDAPTPAPEMTPEELGGSLESSDYNAPGPGEMAPYQRPVDPEGFNPNSEAEMGTGGLY